MTDPGPVPVPVPVPAPKPSFLVGYKTILVNLAIASALGGLSYAQSQDWVTIFKDHPQYAVWMAAAISALNMVLRAGTNTTVFKATSPAPMPPPQ